MSEALHTAILHAAGTVNSLAADVDRLGTLKAEAKALNDQIKALEAGIKASGLDVIEGALFRATVSHSERSRVDWKAVAAKLEPSRQLVTAHTSTSEVVALRVVAHSK